MSREEPQLPDKYMNTHERADAYWKLKELALRSLIQVDPSQFSPAQKELAKYLKAVSSD